MENVVLFVVITLCSILGGISFYLVKQAKTIVEWFASRLLSLASLTGVGVVLGSIFMEDEDFFVGAGIWVVIVVLVVDFFVTNKK